MLNVSKVNVSVKKALKLPVQYVWTLTSAGQDLTFVVRERPALTSLDRLNVNAMLDLSEHRQDCRARRHVMTSNADLTLTVKPKEMKLSATAKKVGLSFHRTSQRAALTSTSATNLMDLLVCAESTLSARTETEPTIVLVHQDFQAIRSSNASISTSAHDRMLAVKTPSAKTHKDLSLVSAQKAPLPIPTQPCDASLSSLVRRAAIALAMPFAILTSAACVPNPTSEMIVVIHANT